MPCFKTGEEAVGPGGQQELSRWDTVAPWKEGGDKEALVVKKTHLPMQEMQETWVRALG